MVNPDGVIAGNFRSSLAGVDLNRRWTEPDRRLQQQIFRIKAQIAKRSTISYFIDLHGHSKSLNSFAYCSKSLEGDQRLLPAVLSLISQSFRYNQCLFNYDPLKQDTARYNFSRINARRSLTIQTSMWGYQMDEQVIRFTPKQLKNLGRQLGQALLVHFSNNSVRGVSKKKAILEMNSLPNPKPQYQKSESNPCADEIEQISKSLLQMPKTSREREKRIKTSCEINRKTSGQTQSSLVKLSVNQKNTQFNYDKFKYESRVQFKPVMRRQQSTAKTKLDSANIRSYLKIKKESSIRIHQDKLYRTKNSFNDKTILNLNVIDLGMKIDQHFKPRLKSRINPMRRKGPSKSLLEKDFGYRIPTSYI